MPSEELPAQFVDAPFRGFDQEELLPFLLYLAFPPIDGKEAREDVDAGGQAHFHQLAGEGGGIKRSMDRGEDEDRLQWMEFR